MNKWRNRTLGKFVDFQHPLDRFKSIRAAGLEDEAVKTVVAQAELLAAQIGPEA